jgi:hypothetical protein
MRIDNVSRTVRQPRGADAARSRRTSQNQYTIQTIKMLPAVSNRNSGRINRAMAAVH